jgi:hypothetical protein
MGRLQEFGGYIIAIPRDIMGFIAASPSAKNEMINNNPIKSAATAITLAAINPFLLVSVGITTYLLPEVYKTGKKGIQRLTGSSPPENPANGSTSSKAKLDADEENQKKIGDIYTKQRVAACESGYQDPGKKVGKSITYTFPNKAARDKFFAELEINNIPYTATDESGTKIDRHAPAAAPTAAAVAPSAAVPPIAITNAPPPPPLPAAADSSTQPPPGGAGPK